jgi:hypothetical protein
MPSMQPNKINRNIFSNPEAVEGVMGQAVPGTFNRQVGNNNNPMSYPQDVNINNQATYRPAPVPAPVDPMDPMSDYNLTNQ